MSGFRKPKERSGNRPMRSKGRWWSCQCSSRSIRLHSRRWGSGHQGSLWSGQRVSPLKVLKNAKINIIILLTFSLHPTAMVMHSHCSMATSRAWAALPLPQPKPISSRAITPLWMPLHFTVIADRTISLAEDSICKLERVTRRQWGSLGFLSSAWPPSRLLAQQICIPLQVAISTSTPPEVPIITSGDRCAASPISAPELTCDIIFKSFSHIKYLHAAKKRNMCRIYMHYIEA